MNNLGDLIAVSSSGEKISVVASCAFSKRYIKKYLKKQNLRDYIRVVASGKGGYKVWVVRMF